MQTIGIDIGASKIGFVLLENSQVIKTTKKIATPSSKEKLLALLKENINQMISGLAKPKVQGIGIGVPGPLNNKGDLILNPPNLKYLSQCPLAKIIEKELKLKTTMENDSNCFTLAEALLGAGQGFKTVFGITLGSGVGGGIVIGGKIYQGSFSSTSEVGHMIINFDGPACSCGSHGCLEEYCSKRFFLKHGTTPQKANKSLYQEYGKYLGIGLANIINLLDPEVIVVGGGISKSLSLFLKQARQEALRLTLSPISRKCVKIKKAKLGEFSGAIGAGLLFNYDS